MFNAKLHVPMPGFSSDEGIRLRDVEKRSEKLVNQTISEKSKNPRADHAQLQSVVATMREFMPRRTCPRPPPGFDRNDTYYNHVPNNRVPVVSVPHSRHEALRAPTVPPPSSQRRMSSSELHLLEEFEGMC